MFANILFFSLEEFDHSADALTQALQQTPFHPCAKFEQKSQGWVAPAGGDSPLVREANGYTLITACFEKKKVKPDVVKRLLAEKVEEHEARHGEPPAKKVIKEYKAQIELEMLPSIYPDQDYISIMISPDRTWLAVSTGSAPKAEDTLSMLRRDLESLKVKPLTASEHPPIVFTGWLKAQEAPENIDFNGDAVLADGDGGTVTMKRQDMFGDEVKRHLESDKQAIKIGMTYDGVVTFTVNDKLVVSGVKYDGSEADLEEGSEMSPEEEQAYVTDGTLVLTGPYLRDLYNFLTDNFIDV